MDLNSDSDESGADPDVPASSPQPVPPQSTALVVEPAWQRLTSYLEAHGGSAALVSGWRTRSGRRASDGGKAHDVYYYDEQNTKFRSCKEVAQYFGLIAATQASNRCAHCLHCRASADQSQAMGRAIQPGTRLRNLLGQPCESCTHPASEPCCAA